MFRLQHEMNSNNASLINKVSLFLISSQYGANRRCSVILRVFLDFVSETRSWTLFIIASLCLEQFSRTDDWRRPAAGGAREHRQCYARGVVYGCGRMGSGQSLPAAEWRDGFYLIMVDSRLFNRIQNLSHCLSHLLPQEKHYLGLRPRGHTVVMHSLYA